jgi:integrase
MLYIECPTCKQRRSLKREICCGINLTNLKFKIYWVDVAFPGRHRVRERIGPSLAAAEHRERELLIAKAEERWIKKDPSGQVTLGELADWYLALPEVKAKRSYGRDVLSIAHLKRFMGGMVLREIIPALIESYRYQRLAESSGRTPGTLTTPATVNRELACLKTIFNKAVANEKIMTNPAAKIKLMKENNERSRVLNHSEYQKLIRVSPPHLADIITVAYYTAMRAGEIMGLTWDMVDMRERILNLPAWLTKTQEARIVPMAYEVAKVLHDLPRGFPGTPVFRYRGKGVSSVQRSFKKACQNAGIKDFTFHDLRHTAINNWRLAGHDYFRIMAASGHKSMSVFKRYNTVSKAELMKLVGT